MLFEDFTHVKFYRRSFFDVVEDEGGRFDGFIHVDDGCRSASSPPPARTRCRGDLGGCRDR